MQCKGMWRNVSLAGDITAIWKSKSAGGKFHAVVRQGSGGLRGTSLLCFGSLLSDFGPDIYSHLKLPLRVKKRGELCGETAGCKRGQSVAHQEHATGGSSEHCSLCDIQPLGQERERGPCLVWLVVETAAAGRTRGEISGEPPCTGKPVLATPLPFSTASVLLAPPGAEKRDHPVGSAVVW